MIVVLLAVGVVWYALAPHLPRTPDRVSDVAELEMFLGKLVETGDPPGLSMVIVKDGGIVYRKGFGLSGPSGNPSTPETIYHWFSMTKVVTAIAILQLYEDGLLDLDDPVIDHLSWFDVQYPNVNGEAITIAHLLNHSSGLSDPGTPEIISWIHFEESPRIVQTELIKEILPDYNELVVEPGIEGRYSNIGTMVLAAVIEAVSGQSYEAYVIEHILEPLNMEHTDFIYTDGMLPYEAAGSHPNIDVMSLLAPFLVDMDRVVLERRDGRMWFNHFYTDQTAPSGLIGPPTGVARFMMAYLNNGELDGQSVLSPESIDMMTNKRHVIVEESPAGRIPGLKLGLGWFIVESERGVILSYGGGGMGFKAMMRLYPEESLGIAVMANGTNLDSTGIINLVSSLEW